MKKSIVISLLTITILFCSALCSWASTGVVTTDTLNLRKEASMDASILALLSMNDEVEILEEENGWYKVKSGEQVGYVAKNYIKVHEEVNSDDSKVEGEETTQNSENEEKTLVKTISSGVKVYITPLISSIVLNTTSEEKQVEVTSELNGWSYITAKDIKGWVRNENIVEKEVSESEKNNNNSSQKTGYISGSSVNFREEANTSGAVISKLTKNTEVKILGTENGWTKIEYEEKTGYVSSTYISDTKITTTSRSSVNRTTKTTTKKTTKTSSTTKKEETKAKTNTATTAKKEEAVTKTDTATTTTKKEETVTTKEEKVKVADIVAYAKKYLGYKYVYGGTSPKTGFDCSGFTSYVYKHFGYSLSRTSSSQASNGKAVSRSNLQAGDIICFSGSSSSKKIGHVGIYIGGGKFIHAANSRKGVIISNVSGDGFYYVCARRIV